MYKWKKGNLLRLFFGSMILALSETSEKHVTACWYCLVTQLCPDSVTVWTLAHQAPLSMEFSRQEYWRGLPFPSPGDLPDPGIEPVSHALAGGFFTLSPQGSPCYSIVLYIFLLNYDSRETVVTL